MNQIREYREQVIEALKQSNNHYTTEVVNLSVAGKLINYHRWLHPWQGDWEIKELFTEEILTNLSKIIRPNSTVIDIGAHTGNMSVAYSLYADKVLAFEPNPVVYEVLEKNSQLNPSIKPFNCAASDEEGPLTFHYSDYGFCNGGFATRTQTGIGVTGHVIPIDVWAVNVERYLKDESIDIDDLSLIKIDAEGHDNFILKTLSNIIAKYKPVIITEIYTGSTAEEIDALIDTVHALGYRAYDEEVNCLDLSNLGKEVLSHKDVNMISGNNIICIP